MDRACRRQHSGLQSDHLVTSVDIQSHLTPDQGFLFRVESCIQSSLSSLVACGAFAGCGREADAFLIAPLEKLQPHLGAPMGQVHIESDIHTVQGLSV